jgi:hypothetical protein
MPPFGFGKLAMFSRHSVFRYRLPYGRVAGHAQITTILAGVLWVHFCCNLFRSSARS